MAITEALQAGGHVHHAEGLTLWVDPDGLSEAEIRVFLVQMEQGLRALRQHLGALQDAPDTPPPLEVYMSPQVGMSHVRGDVPTMVYMPTWRIRDHTAPYLHEFVHAIASWSWRHSEWLGEGLANHVAAAVEPVSGGYHHSVIVPDGLQDVEAHLHSLQGSEVLALIGPRGRRSSFPPELAVIFDKTMRDRRGYGTPFYALSWSFVDYLVERDGLAALRDVAMDETHIARRKQEWLRRLSGASNAAEQPEPKAPTAAAAY